MKSKTTRYLITGIVAILATSFILVSLQGSASSQQFNIVPLGGIGYVVGPDAFLEHGGKSAIVMTAPTGVLTASRGQDIDAQISLTHKAGKDPLSTVTLQLDGVGNTLILPSTVKAQTPGVIAEELKENKTVTGMIKLDPYVSYSPSVITLSPGQTEVVTMHIHIPNLPDEMVGKHVRFVPNIIPQQSDLSNLGIFPAMITVQVVR